MTDTRQDPAQALLRLIDGHERVMHAARIDMTRGDYGAAARLLDEQLDGFDGLPWNGTETGLEWLERVRAAGDGEEPDEDEDGPFAGAPRRVPGMGEEDADDAENAL